MSAVGSESSVAMHRPYVVLAALLLFGLGACSSSAQPSAAPSVEMPSGSPTERLGELGEGNEPIGTESDHYELRREDDWLRADISYKFTNRTGGPVYLVNCNRGFVLQLERLTDSGWQRAWSPAQNDCLSPPIVIDPGSTFDHTLKVVAGLPGTNMHPQFDVEDPSGIYRIVWIDALSSFDAEKRPFGSQIPLEERISNPFRLGTP